MDEIEKDIRHIRKAVDENNRIIKKVRQRQNAQRAGKFVWFVLIAGAVIFGYIKVQALVDEIQTKVEVVGDAGDSVKTFFGINSKSDKEI